MQFSLLAAASLLAASVSAFEVLTPTLNSTVAKGETLTIEWSAVDTDAELFSIYITNFQTHHWPPTVLSLAQNVPRDDLSIDLRIPFALSSDYGWQINFINGTNTYVIYAQSPAFFLEGEGTDPEPTHPPYPTGYTNTTTATVHYPGTTVTETATSTATLCKTVSTVVYATPIVWFVEPSKEAVCEHAPTVTVTVTPGGEHATATSSPGGEHATATSSPVGGHEGYPTTTGPGHASATGTGAYHPTASQPAFEGAASALEVSSLIAVVIGAVAFLL